MKLMTISYDRDGVRHVGFRAPDSHAAEPREVGPCPQCGWPMIDGDQKDARRVSRDHILPKSRGGILRMYGDVRNSRTMCQVCNGQLASCLHCVGALACVRDVTDDTKATFKSIARKWGFPGLAERERRATLNAVIAVHRDDRRVALADAFTKDFS